MRTIDEDDWYIEYDVIDEILEDDPEGVEAKYVWTEIESDGDWVYAAGRHLVNRTGRYFVSRRPHDFDVIVDASWL